MKNKSTQELLQMMKKTKDYHSYLEQNRGDIATNHMKIDRALNVMLTEKNVKKSEAIARSGLENHYAYQILSGTKKPTRDKVIMLCVGIGLSLDETQNILRITNYAQLYVKNQRDNAIMFSLTKHLSVVEINSLLFELGLDLLI